MGNTVRNNDLLSPQEYERRVAAAAAERQRQEQERIDREAAALRAKALSTGTLVARYILSEAVQKETTIVFVNQGKNEWYYWLGAEAMEVAKEQLAEAGWSMKYFRARWYHRWWYRHPAPNPYGPTLVWGVKLKPAARTEPPAPNQAG
jgi:hypothetical protein